MNTLFNSKFIADLPPDPSRAIRACIRRYWALLEESDRDNPCYEEALECLALVQVVAAKGRVTLQLPEVTGSLKEDLRKINDAFRKIAEEIDKVAGLQSFDQMRSFFETQLGVGFGYEFSEGDVQRVQALLNELRDLVATSAAFEPGHRTRVLDRLERLQTEMHKRVSDLDRFWGLLADAGIALGKLGRHAKPIVDRVREIMMIVWRAQARSAELPSGTTHPLLDVSDIPSSPKAPASDG